MAIRISNTPKTFSRSLSPYYNFYVSVFLVKGDGFIFEKLSQEPKSFPWVTCVASGPQSGKNKSKATRSFMDHFRKESVNDQ
ncbi:hypothetical protein NPIL_476301 [Nephila pilipes]|uniref:Uncharacterized protein n=1 Tax=Nephila pilipes TaxID=299642 RepID=A0A8X6U963_NEPPI|nr:hypothetical protein NPIL_476301 [Nephila pilipes]